MQNCLSRTKELQDELGWSVHRKVMLSNMPLFEELLHVNICALLPSEGKKTGGFLRIKNSLGYPKISFLLLHECYYGVKDTRNVLG